jgi:phage-related protein
VSYDYINFICQLSSTPGLYSTLDECQSAVANGTVQSVIQLSPLWDIEKKTSMPLVINKLGDNYKQVFFEGKDEINEEWIITSPVLTEIQCNTLLNQLLNLSTKSFLWSPSEAIPHKSYTCDEWKKNRLGTNTYQIKATFKNNLVSNQSLEYYVPPPPPTPTYTYVLTTHTTWTNAQAQAQQMGGNLVTIRSAQENQKLIDTFGGTEPFWIGYNDANQEGTFTWISGEPTTYTSWFPGKPDNAFGNQDYCMINFAVPGMWDDAGNDNNGFGLLRGIVEIPVN